MKSIRLASFAALAAALLAAGNAGCSASASEGDEATGTQASAFDKSAIGAMPTAVYTATPTPPSTTYQGRLSRIMVGKRASGGAGGYRWFVQTADKKIQEVTLSSALIAQAGGVTAITSKVVTISGKTFADTNALVADNLLVLANDNGPPPLAPPPVVGAKKWLTVPCRFSDVPNADPHGPEYFRGIMGAAAPGAGDYFAKASNGRLSIDGSTVLDWQDLPFPASFYNGFDANARLGLLMQDCLSAADWLVDYSQFDGLQLAFSHNLETQLVGGPLSLELDGVLKTFHFGVLSPNEFANQANVVRTMGVGLDMTFSGAGPLQLTSPWDFMSQGFATNGVSCKSLTSSFGCGAVLPAGEQSARSGWIDPGHVATVVADGSGTFELDFAGALPASGHVGVIRLPIDSQHWYTIEARKSAAGSYDIGVPQTDVVIHQMDGVPLPDSPTDAQLLEATTRLRLVAALGGATTYVNNAIDLKLSLVQRPYGYTVTVNRGPKLRVTKKTDVRVAGPGIDCGTTGHDACAVQANFGDTITLTAYPTTGRQVKSWSGCTSSLGTSCTVTMDQSKTVSVTTEAAPTGPEPGECYCPPTMPLYKCQQICGDNF